MSRSRGLTETHASRRWMSLDEASRRLGISATTLRRWSDAGLVETFVTPGGHRRFEATSVDALLPGSPNRPTMEILGETPERMSRVYRRETGRRGLPWIGTLDETQRSAFREHGRLIAGELLATLDAATESDRTAHLAAASATAAQYGVATADRGVPASATVEAFLRFRRPFLRELGSVGRRRGLDTGAATELVARASDAFDQLLVATMRAYEEAAADSHRGAGPQGSADARTGLRLPADAAASFTSTVPLSPGSEPETPIR